MLAIDINLIVRYLVGDHPNLRNAQLCSPDEARRKPGHVRN